MARRTIVDRQGEPHKKPTGCPTGAIWHLVAGSQRAPARPEDGGGSVAEVPAAATAGVGPLRSRLASARYDHGCVAATTRETVQ